jgi:hypothetical protein
MRMHTYFTRLLLVMLTVAGLAAPAGANDNQAAMTKMAKIMHQLNHYPSAEDKKVLNEIAAAPGIGARQKTLAEAMLNLEHAVADKDAPKLNAIINDKGASNHERDLARIILNLNHKASDDDKKRLQSMM